MAEVLVVEDDPGIREVVADYLTAAGHTVTAVEDVAQALRAVARSAYDLVVLDLGLPGGRDGLDLAGELRRTSQVPIVMVTARDDETDRIVGLELGADDYVTKPFSPRELVARVKAVLRRAQAGAVTTAGAGPGGADVLAPLRVGDVSLHLDRRRAEVAGEEVDLTVTEFDLLAALLAAPGRVFTRGQLLEAVRGVSFESYERSIDSHVKNLRRKVERDPGAPEVVLTVRGVGYRAADG